MTVEILWVAGRALVAFVGLTPLVIYVLRQRLVIRGEWVGSTDVQDGDEYLVVVQNAEGNPLTVPFELRLEAMNRGTISKCPDLRRSDMAAGREGKWKQERAGVWVYRANGLGGMETWRMFVETKGAAQRLRVRIRGWDPDDGEARSWFPVLAKEGHVLEVCPADRWSKDVRYRPGWVWAGIGAALSAFLYVLLVPGIDRQWGTADWWILSGLLAIGWGVFALFAQRASSLPIGFLASDEHVARENACPDPGNAGAPVV